MARVLFVAAIMTGCGADADPIPPPGPNPPPDFGQFVLSGLDVDCEGVVGLNGDAILAARADQMTATLSYINSAGMRIDPTALTIDVTWPVDPAATCYPARTGDPAVMAPARVAIEGLTMQFLTADGRFNETLAAKAWRRDEVGMQVHLLGVTTHNQLSGSFQPDPAILPGDHTLAFFALSNGTMTANGNVGLNSQDPAERDAGILRSGFAVAVYP